MRSTRSAMYRKKYRKLVIFAQILAIWYATVVSASLLTSETVAYFSSHSQTNGIISSAEYWWDKSELQFTGKKTQNVKACAPEEISVEIKNIGLDMANITEFEVYYVESGNPENPHGEKVGDGVIEALSQNEAVHITFMAEEGGFYTFKAFQRPGFNDDYDERQEIWSEMVHLNCNAAKEEIEVQEENQVINKNQNESDEVDGEENKSNENKEQIESEDSSDSKKKEEKDVEENKDKGKEIESELEDKDVKKHNDEQKNKKETEIDIKGNKTETDENPREDD
ncbi:amyloid fiber anchoring/assembly protein TapA [Evansella halocellulosilytica]|uniref:amyloid fiber anchoring/assembly protein TapA n=1 Tax=Evansella halocellulosilytica TaxID=2011013 RepID=UPI000BB790BA|nr:amyloid fiber anchoring/assembly protein TapA [Evansella halocellulosilytica]